MKELLRQCFKVADTPRGAGLEEWAMWVDALAGEEKLAFTGIPIQWGDPYQAGYPKTGFIVVQTTAIVFDVQIGFYRVLRMDEAGYLGQTEVRTDTSDPDWWIVLAEGVANLLRGEEPPPAVPEGPAMQMTLTVGMLRQFLEEMPEEAEVNLFSKPDLHGIYIQGELLLIPRKK